MKVFISGINPKNDLKGKLKELGHEPVFVSNSQYGKGDEGSSKPLILDSEAVICDLTVKKGIEDHRFASSEGKPVLSLRDAASKEKTISSNIEIMSTIAHFSSQDEIKMIIREFLNGNLKSKESEHSVSIERG